LIRLNANQRDQLLNIIHGYVPDATWTDEPDNCTLEESCGCYSEYTTESCRFVCAVDSPKHVDRSPDGLDEAVERWVRGNLEFSGCACCSGTGHENEGYAVDYNSYNSSLSLWPRIFNPMPATP